MKNCINYIYNYLFLPVAKISLKLLSKRNKNIKNYIKVRKTDYLLKDIVSIKKKISDNTKVIWFHAASLGEYEQAKPIINLIKKHYTNNVYIIVSFFSSSGYNYAKYSDGYFDLKFYLPFDSVKNAVLIIKNLQPDILFFLGYDVWQNILFQMKKNSKKAYLINATIKENSLRINKYLNFYFKNVYSKLDGIFAVSETAKKRYSKIYPQEKIMVTGDSRFDNVVERKKSVNTDEIKRTLLGKFILIIGSSHSADESIIIPALKPLYETIPNLLVIFAPHNVSENKISTLTEKFNQLNYSYVKYSVFEQNLTYNNEKIILIDSIGKLFNLYSLGNCAYIGGSFKEGVHNIMEPSAFDLFVIVGPVYNNSNEAVEMNELNLISVVNNSEEFANSVINLYNNTDVNTLKENITKYIKSKTSVAKYIFENLIQSQF